jgi:dolichol-phosphate mannosyltransferase
MMMDLKRETLVIVPTYNESKNVSNLLNLFVESSFDVLIVDDNSPDRTSEIVKNYILEYSNINLLERSGKLGLGSAYRDGFNWALERRYKSIVEMDADFSHSFSDLSNLDNYKKDYDLVIGSRYVSGGKTEGWSRSRKLLSTTANKIAKTLLKIKVNDMTSGFRIYSRECLESINYQNTKSNGYAFQIEMTLLVSNNNRSIKEIPITFYERSMGDSKMSKAIVFEAVKFLLTNMFNKRT